MKCKLEKHISAPIICNEILGEKNVKFKMQTHRLSLDEGVENLNRVMLESANLMQQHTSDALIQEEK
jgi:hypothetical protein